MKNDIQLNGSLLQQIASYTALASIMTYQIPNQQHDGNAAAPLFYSFGTDDEAKPTKKKQWTLLIGGVTTILLLVISGGYRNQIPANTVDAVVASSLPHGLEIEEVNRNSFRSTTTTTAGAATTTSSITFSYNNIVIIIIITIPKQQLQQYLTPAMHTRSNSLWDDRILYVPTGRLQVRCYFRMSRFLNQGVLWSIDRGV